MFEQTFIAAQTTKRERAIAFVLIGQTVVVTGLGLLPLLSVESLGPMKQFVALPPIRLDRNPVEPTQKTPIRSATSFRPVFVLPSVKPSLTNQSRVVTVDEIGIPDPSAATSGASSGLPFGVPFGEVRVAPPTRSSPEQKPALPVHLTSTIAQSQLIYGPKPVYPHLAVVSRSEGTVKLQAIISRDGKIENLHVITGPALLISAAMDAVRSWRYKPLLLNGEPVEVITEIDVIFNLR